MPDAAPNRSGPAPSIEPSRPSVPALLSDLEQEQRDVGQLVAGIGEQGWALPTTPGWTVRDQVAHLAYFDSLASISILDPDRFVTEKRLALSDTVAYERESLGSLPADGGAVQLAWLSASDRFRQAAWQADPAVRLPWFGPGMGLLSMITARLMETWAHGQDIADGLAVHRRPTGRLQHVASLAYRARAEGYRARGLALPEVDIRVELAAPDGVTWSFGRPDAGQVVRGSAEEFCLVLIRRRHVEDTSLRWDGAAAGEWLRIGQAYAGPPGAGPRRLRGRPDQEAGARR